MNERALVQRLALHRAALETLIRHVEAREHRWRPFVAGAALAGGEPSDQEVEHLHAGEVRLERHRVLVEQ